MSDEAAATTPDDLDAFFREIRPLLLGESRAEDFQERLGASPSGARRLALYTRLVGNDLASGMEGLYPAVHVALDRLGAASAGEMIAWRPLLAEYFRAHPPAHWDINVCGAAFASWLAERRAAHPTWPVVLEELADLQWLEYQVYTSAAVMPRVGLNPTAELRQYTHAIASWSRAARHSTAEGLPEARATMIIVYRDPSSLLTRTLSAEPAMLLVLAREQGLTGGAIADGAAQLGDEALSAARASLLRAGVLLETPG